MTATQKLRWCVQEEYADRQTHRSRHSACGPSDRLHIMCCIGLSHVANQIRINLNISVTDFVVLTATIVKSVRKASVWCPSVRPSVP